MKVTSKGQVTIPLEIRQQLSIVSGCEVNFTLRGKRVYIEKDSNSSRGKALVASLRNRHASGMTTDEIMALTRGDQ